MPKLCKRVADIKKVRVETDNGDSITLKFWRDGKGRLRFDLRCPAGRVNLTPRKKLP